MFSATSIYCLPAPAIAVRRAALLGAAMLALPFAAPVAAAGPAGGALYVFGDSDSDQGNLARLRGERAADRPGYFCPDDLCRDSNGPVWAERLGRPVAALLAGPPVAGRGVSFAVSGAHMTARGEPDVPPSGVAVQIDQFAALVAQGRIRPAPADLFVIQAGTNDLLRLAEGDAPEAIGGDIVTAASDHVRRLAGLGARTVLVAEVAPVQYLPMVAGAELAPLRTALTTIVGGVNDALVTTLADLRPGLPAGTNLVLIRQQAFFDWLAANHGALGLAPLDRACVDADGRLCAPDAAAQNRFVWFDSNHLSGSGHQLYARWVGATLDGASGAAAAQTAQLPHLALAQAARLRGLADAARSAGTGPADGIRLFAAPLHERGRFAGPGGDARSRTRTDGGLIGLGGRFGAAEAGLSVAWTRARTAFADGGAARARTLSVTGFAGIDLPVGMVEAGFTYGAPRLTDLRRQTGLPGLVAQGRTRGRHLAAMIGYANRIAAGPFTAEVRSRLVYERIRLDGFAEDGAEGLALIYDRQRLARTGLESRMEAAWRIAGGEGGGLSVAPFVEADSRVNVAGGRQTLLSQLAGNIALPAQTVARDSARDTVDLGGGIRLGSRAGFDLTARHVRTVAGPARGSSLWSLALAMRF